MKAVVLPHPTAGTAQAPDASRRWVAECPRVSHEELGLFTLASWNINLAGGGRAARRKLSAVQDLPWDVLALDVLTRDVG